MDSAIISVLIANDSLLEAGEPVDLRRGLNVIYGLNGAGKSRLLTGIEAAVRGIGVDTNVALVVKIVDVAGTESSSEARAQRIGAYGRMPGEAIAAALASPRAFPWEDREFASAQELRTPDPDIVQDLLFDWIASRAGSDSALADEITHDCLFLFLPTGSPSSPAWDVWPVADMRRPEARAELHRLDLLYDRYSSMPFDDEKWSDTQDDLETATEASLLFPTAVNELWASIGRRQRLLMPAPLVPYAIGERDATQVEPIRVSGKIDFNLELVDASREPNDATRVHFGKLHSYLMSHVASSPDNEPTLASFQIAGLRLLSPRLWDDLTIDREPVRDWSTVLAGPTEERELDLGPVDAVMQDVVKDLESRVNAILQSVLLDAPRASLFVNPPALRFVREPLVWTFGTRGLRLRELSRAETLWASRAIHEAIHDQLRDLALNQSQRRAVLSVVDEPESALHRAAEAHMAATLRRRGGDSIVVAATHSPELLDAQGNRVIEVQRAGGSRGRSLVHELDLADRASLANLGLLPSDLLQWPRVILLVEGEHDEVLLETFLGDQLRRARVRVLPLHGGSKLPGTVDSQVLFEHTNAHVVAMLDNMRAARLNDVWARAVNLALRGDKDAAKQEVLTGLPDDKKRKGDEAGYMRSWLIKAIDAGLEARATPYGLEEVDVIRYLPVNFFVPSASGWAELDTQHQDEFASALPDRRPPSDFKKWLSLRWKVDVTPQSLRDAARGLPVPRDFLRLMKTLEAISADVR